MNFFKIKTIMVAIALTAGLSACSNPGPTERAEERQAEQSLEHLDGYRLKADAFFLKEYAGYMLTSIAMAELAVDRATNPEVKAFARQVMADHRELYVELAELGRREKLPIPEDLSQEFTGEVETLRETAPHAFDRKYLEKVVENHKTLREDSEEVIKKTKLESIVDFVAKAKSQNFIHYNKVQKLLADVT